MEGGTANFNRDLTQQDGGRTQDGRMTKKCYSSNGNAQSRAKRFGNSAVLSLPAVLLRKVSNRRANFIFSYGAVGLPYSDSFYTVLRLEGRYLW